MTGRELAIVACIVWGVWYSLAGVYYAFRYLRGYRYRIELAFWETVVIFLIVAMIWPFGPSISEIDPD